MGLNRTHQVASKVSQYKIWLAIFIGKGLPNEVISWFLDTPRQLGNTKKEHRLPEVFLSMGN